LKHATSGQFTAARPLPSSQAKPLPQHRPRHQGGRAQTAALIVLAVGGVGMLAACGSPSSSTAAAGSPKAAASVATSAITPTTASLFPAASSPALAASAAGPASTPTTAAPHAAVSVRAPASAGRVTASAASRPLVAELERVANRDQRITHTAGYTSAADFLHPVYVTNNGWAMGRIIARNPRNQGNADIIFRQRNGSWTAFSCGSDFTGSGIPQAVLKALYNPHS
jgi:hypothetical protein